MPDSRPSLLLINPWIYDFAAYDFFARPLGLLYLAGLLIRQGWHYAATGYDKFGVNMEAKASGELVEVAIEGFVKDVSLSGTGTVTTCYSTFTRGYAVMVNATGHLTMRSATWVAAYWSASTANTTANAVIGIALSSGDTGVIQDLWLVGKPTIHPTATA